MKAILELEMPESCSLCNLYVHGVCIITHKDILDCFDKRPDDCPLKPKE